MLLADALASFARPLAAPAPSSSPSSPARIVASNGAGAPPPAPPGGGQGDEDSDVATEQERKVQRPKRWKVLFHNDDYTTREFVIDVLIRFFDKDESEATFIMLSVHHKGHGVAGYYPKDVAESKVDKTMKHARGSGFPLKVTAEPE